MFAEREKEQGTGNLQYVKIKYCKYLQFVNQSLKGLHIIAQGFNPGYRSNVNQSAVGATYAIYRKDFTN